MIYVKVVSAKGKGYMSVCKIVYSREGSRKGKITVVAYSSWNDGTGSGIAVGVIVTKNFNRFAKMVILIYDYDKCGHIVMINK